MKTPTIAVTILVLASGAAARAVVLPSLEVDADEYQGAVSESLR